MKNFGSVGKRLRRLRAVAYLFYAIAIFIFAAGTMDYLARGAPRAWRRDPVTWEMRNELLSSKDPEWYDVIHMRWSQYLYFVFWASGIGAVGTLAFLASRKAPTKEVILLAQVRHGLLTLPEVSTTLDIDPHLAAGALKQLQRLQIATPRWQEYRKNLWEFPDYLEVPIDGSLELAQKAGGRLSLKDLLSNGYSLDVAQRIIDTLTEKGLAQQDPASPMPSLILQAQ